VKGILKAKLHFTSCNTWQLLLLVDFTQHKTKVDGSVDHAGIHQAITELH